ncbi:hypothetical protein ACWIGW_16750 [Nocardia brasiliensis]
MSNDDDDLIALFDDVTQANHTRIANLLLLLTIPIEIETDAEPSSQEMIGVLLNARELLYDLPMHPICREALGTAILDFLGGLAHVRLAFDDPADRSWLIENAALTMLRVKEQLLLVYDLLTGAVAAGELEPGRE